MERPHRADKKQEEKIGLKMETKEKLYPFLKNSTIEKETLGLMKSYAEKTGKIIKAPIPVFDLIEYLGYNVDFRSDGIYEDENLSDVYSWRRKLF